MMFKVWEHTGRYQGYFCKTKKKEQLNLMHKRPWINLGIMLLIQSHAKVFLCCCDVRDSYVWSCNWCIWANYRSPEKSQEITSLILNFKLLGKGDGLVDKEWGSDIDDLQNVDNEIVEFLPKLICQQKLPMLIDVHNRKRNTWKRSRILLECYSRFTCAMF